MKAIGILLLLIISLSGAYWLGRSIERQNTAPILKSYKDSLTIAKTINQRQYKLNDSLMKIEARFKQLMTAVPNTLMRKLPIRHRQNFSAK